MSSKVLLPGHERDVSPIVWKTVDESRSTVSAAMTAHGIPLSPSPQAASPPDVATRLAELEQQYQQKVREAHAAGVREGEAGGRQRAVAETQPIIQRLSQSIQELVNLRARLRHEAEADVVRLALAIARRVVRRELAADPDAVKGLVMAALEKLQSQELSRVKTHPAHLPAVRACLQAAISGNQLEAIADPALDLGGVLFETTRGNLDASVESQLQEIERGLTDRLRKQA